MKLSTLEQNVYAATLASVVGQIVNKGRSKVIPTVHRAAEFAKQAVLETRIQLRSNGNGNGGKNKNGVRP